MNYLEKLIKSSEESGNCICMGLDFQQEYLPVKSGDFHNDVESYCKDLFEAMSKEDLTPAAFKPNIGYYTIHDKPRKNDFSGSITLSSVLDLLEEYFPNIPVILDSKRGDIARSSLNYAFEAFESWQTDSVTISPYMGTDSIEPFNFENKGIYILNRTSNSGASDLQNLVLENNEPLYKKVASQIIRWAEKHSGVGAVVGATSEKELKEIASFYASKNIPLLIPGVGSQGASAQKTIEILKEANYPIKLARINSSSNLTHPWKDEDTPKDYLEMALDNIASLIKECQI